MIKNRKKNQSNPENIIEKIGEGYYEIDLDGRLTLYNSSLRKILGYTTNGTKYSDDGLNGVNLYKFSDKAQADRIYNIYRHVYESGQPANIANWKIIRRDGKKLIVEASVSLIQDENKNPLGYRGLIRDTTFRVKTEIEREKLKNQRFQAQKMEAIGTIAGGIAHDLNNILSGIVSYPDLLLMKVPPASPLRKTIEAIRKSGEKASSYVQDLLTLSRKGISNQQVININHVITDFLDSSEHKTQLVYYPLVDVKAALDRNLHSLSGSKIHITKIVTNLIANAAESMPDGGTVYISTKNCPAQTHEGSNADDEKNDYVKLQVVDEGIGISAEDKERIFEPFYTKNVMGRNGTGLEMAVVWGAVQDLNGVIDVKSEPGKGTTFSIFFPAVKNSHKNKPVKILSDQGRGEKILVVDDMQSQRELIAQMLRILGYEAYTVASGEAAIAYVEKKSVDLLILDMKMEPGIDGLETYKEITKINPSQKGIICSGFSTSKRIKEAQSLGIGECLAKPFLIEELARAVRKELDKDTDIN